MNDPDFEQCFKEIVEDLKCDNMNDQQKKESILFLLKWIWIKGRSRGRKEISTYYVNEELNKKEIHEN